MHSESTLPHLGRHCRATDILIAVDLPELSGCDTRELGAVTLSLDSMSGVTVILLHPPEYTESDASNPQLRVTQIRRPFRNSDFASLLSQLSVALDAGSIVHLGLNSPVVEPGSDLDTFSADPPSGIAIDPTQFDQSPQGAIDQIVNILHYVSSMRRTIAMSEAV